MSRLAVFGLIWYQLLCSEHLVNPFCHWTRIHSWNRPKCVITVFCLCMAEEFTVCEVLFNVFLTGCFLLWLSHDLTLVIKLFSLCTVTMKIYVVTIFRNYSKHNIAKVLFLSEAVLTSSHEKTARDVLQLLFHLALMKMSFTRVHSNRGSFYKCVHLLFWPRCF